MLFYKFILKLKLYYILKKEGREEEEEGGSGLPACASVFILVLVDLFSVIPFALLEGGLTAETEYIILKQDKEKDKKMKTKKEEKK